MNKKNLLSFALLVLHSFLINLTIHANEPSELEYFNPEEYNYEQEYIPQRIPHGTYDARDRKSDRRFRTPTEQELIKNRNINDNRYNTNRNFQSSQPQYYNNEPEINAYGHNPPGGFQTYVRDNKVPPPSPAAIYSSYAHHETKRLVRNLPELGPPPLNYTDQIYNSDYNYENTNMTIPAFKRFTEADLLEKLNPKSKKIYLSLDQQGRAIAISLASQESYSPNKAVEEAAKQMNLFKYSSGEAEFR